MHSSVFHAGALNAMDWYFTSGKPHFARLMAGVFKLRGHVVETDFSGTVDAVGRNVSTLSVGDAVFGRPSRIIRQGTLRCPRMRLMRKPATLTFEEAAAVPVAGFTALQALQNADVRAGEKVLINGASAESVPSRCRSRSRWARTSPACAAPATWTSCDHSALTA